VWPPGSRIFARPGNGVPTDVVDGVPRPGSLVRDTKHLVSRPSAAVGWAKSLARKDKRTQP